MTQILALRDVTARFSDYAPNALPVTQAQAIIDHFVQPIDGTETLALKAALGRVLAQDILSPIDVPPHNNSAMDGYAFSGCILHQDEPTRLKCISQLYAGQTSTLQAAAGECIRIMTGAAMPESCDTVVPQELVQLDGDTIVLAPNTVKVGDNRRLAGEDLKCGTVALPKGKLLRPADLGLLASLGMASVTVMRRLRVAFFSTGDELRSLGESLADGCIYDSNRYTVFGMLTRLGCELIDLGVVKDDPVALEQALCTACEQADVVISSGGVSVGEADFTRQIFTKMGDIAFWQLAMRPGRPLTFGKLQTAGKSAWMFGLPGNPVAVMISFYFFARRALLRMMGVQIHELPSFTVPCMQPIRKRAGRTEYQRGILHRDEQGILRVTLTGAQGSGILRSMSEANCIVILEHERGNVAAGELVQTLPFETLL